MPDQVRHDGMGRKLGPPTSSLRRHPVAERLIFRNTERIARPTLSRRSPEMKKHPNPYLIGIVSFLTTVLAIMPQAQIA